MNPPREATLQLTLTILQQLVESTAAKKVKTLRFLVIVLACACSSSKRVLRPSDGVDGLFCTRPRGSSSSSGARASDDGVVEVNTWRRLLEFWVARFAE